MSPTAEVAGVDSFELLTLKMGEAVADVEATDADAAVRVVRRGRGGMLRGCYKARRIGVCWRRPHKTRRTNDQFIES